MAQKAKENLYAAEKLPQPGREIKIFLFMIANSLQMSYASRAAC